MSQAAVLDDLSRRIDQCKRLLDDVERALASHRRELLLLKFMRYDHEELTLGAVIDALADRN